MRLFFRKRIPHLTRIVLVESGPRELYDAKLRLSFVQRLRDERAFPDVDTLRVQIEADCRAARRLFGRISL